jgi:hypothetical protein
MDYAQQDDEQQRLPGWETPQLTGAAQDTNDHPFIDSPPTQTGIDEAMAGRLAAGKQRMAQLGESSLGDTFANAVPGADDIGMAGKTTLPQLLKSYSVAGTDSSIGGAGKPDLAAALENAGKNKRIG